VLPEDDPALRVLVRARDEAHRFAGRYQRQRRAAAFGAGVLDGIPGIGPARRRRLLQTFGSVQGLRDAPFEDLAAVPGIGERLARLLRERLAAHA
jgi:excinuclease ABC subunit C